jgi:hypothetical protein
MQLKKHTSLLALAGTAAGLGISAMLLGGCQCSDPDGCGRTVVPKVNLSVDVPAGTYDEPQQVTIIAPDATAVYYTRDDSTPIAAECYNYDGTPISITDNTIIKVKAVGDGTNYRANSQTLKYFINNPTYTNRQAMNDWLAFEKTVLNGFYCAHNDCEKLAATALQEEINWLLVCDDGFASYQNSPSTYTSTFTFQDCEFNDLTANGEIVLTLNVNALPAIRVAGSGTVSLSGADYDASITDNTARAFRVSGGEYPRGGHYLVNCTGTDCVNQDLKYWYTDGRLWLEDPYNPDICQEQP